MPRHSSPVCQGLRSDAADHRPFRRYIYRHYFRRVKTRMSVCAAHRDGAPDRQAYARARKSALGWFEEAIRDLTGTTEQE